jgi:hypothetical protein
MTENQTQNRDRQSSLILGAILVAAGILLLFSNFELFGALTSLVWTMLFSAGGLVFLYLFLTDYRGRWWAAIPGSALLGLGMVILVDNFAPRFLQPLSGSLFLFAIGVGFALVYIAVPQNWWALIPAGVMTTLAVVAAVDQLNLPWLDGGSVFFIGLGLTFLVLAVLPTQREHQLRWAFIPGGILLIFGLLIGTPFIALFGYLWPLALIIVGVFLIWRRLSTQS